jgi:hypothetical protein
LGSGSDIRMHTRTMAAVTRIRTTATTGRIIMGRGITGTGAIASTIVRITGITGIGTKPKIGKPNFLRPAGAKIPPALFFR